jgi:7-cyano-7-deazaguanine synthase in queuosine biosynthesis
MLPQHELDKCEGSFVYCKMPIEKPSRLEFVNNSGLGVWKINSMNYYQDIIVHNCVAMSRNKSTDALIDEQHYIIDGKTDISANRVPLSGLSMVKNAISLHSGGLDITASVMKYKSNHPHVKITGLYFNWGSVASKQEIEAGQRAKDNGLIEEFIVIDEAKHFMESLFKLIGTTDIRLMDENATGGLEAEAESSMSYVPYRNTFFLTLTAAWVEQNYPGEYVDIIIGGNLTEAMGGYNDGSNAYIDAIEKTLRLGGNEPFKLRVVSPFMNKTKTTMLKSFSANDMQTILDNSFSCYFPDKDGNECGECGSCLLRAKAIERNETWTNSAHKT